MSVRGAALLGVGAMVGAGIFALLGEAGAVAGAAAWISFLLAGIVSVLIGYNVVKLGVRYPSSGGLFEYLLQVPANRIGFTALSLAQLKILQEVITLAVFVPFAVLYMKQQLRWDYLWAGLCIVAAVYFMFRGQQPT